MVPVRHIEHLDEIDVLAMVQLVDHHDPVLRWLYDYMKPTGPFVARLEVVWEQNGIIKTKWL